MTDRPVVFVTQPVDHEALALLAGHADLVYGFGPGAERLADRIADVDVLLVRTEKLTADVFDAAPRLRFVQRVGIGVDSIDLEAASARGIAVFNTGGGNVHTVAEMTIGLALAVARQIPRWDAAVRAGQFAAREHDPGRQLHGRRWGILGFGSIGTEVGRIARQGLGMRVTAYHPRREDDWVRAHGADPAASLHDLLAASDVLSLHVPRRPDTRHLIGAEELAVMRPDAILVNMSRGGVVEEAALRDALGNGRLGGAAVDVFEQEPPPDDHPLFGLPNVVLSPHRGGRTREATSLQGQQAVQRIIALLEVPSQRGALNESLLAPAAVSDP